MDQLIQKSLQYHQSEPAGKISIIPTKACQNADDLSLAYTPGVAFPCLEIKKNPSDAYSYTGKGNLVAVISNGTAVLGLENIGGAITDDGNQISFASIGICIRNGTAVISNGT